MDIRTVTVMALALGGCAGATYDPTPLPGPAALRGAPASEPESAEDRAEAVMSLTADECRERPERCEEPDENVLAGLAWSYPDVQVPASVWRFPTSQDQEVRSLGVTVGVSLGDQTASLDRGNTLTWRADADP